MKKFFGILLPLLAIAAAAGLVTGTAYYFLGPVIGASEVKMSLTPLKEVFPSADSFEEKSTNQWKYYIAYDADKNIAGYIIETEREGYGGPVKALVGITNGAVSTVIIRSMDRETTGVGSRAKDPGWLSQFSGMTWDVSPQNAEDFRNAGLDALTGATLTAMAVAKDVRIALILYGIVTGGVGTNVGMDAITQASVLPSITIKKKGKKAQTNFISGYESEESDGGSADGADETADGAEK